MPLQTIAQELEVIDQSMSDMDMEGEPMRSEVHLHHHYPETQEYMDDDLTVNEPVDIELVVEELPGAPEGTKDPEPVLEVTEDPVNSEELSAEDSDSKKPKKNEKWDWESKGATGFVTWVKERLESVPKHSGYDSAGLERAVAYLDRLDNEISKAMRLDLDGELDANKIEEVRAKIDDGISRLNQRLDKVKKNKKSNRKKKSNIELDDSIIKEAQKITGVQGVYITVPLLVSRIARVCINGMVSAGHDIEDLFEKQANKYKLNEREKAEVMQLLSDMGYPLRQDRGYLLDEDLDVSDGGADWAVNYKG